MAATVGSDTGCVAASVLTSCVTTLWLSALRGFSALTVFAVSVLAFLARVSFFATCKSFLTVSGDATALDFLVVSSGKFLCIKKIVSLIYFVIIIFFAKTSFLPLKIKM